jgi:hypothetical protein
LGNEIGLAMLCFVAIAGYMANTAMKLLIMLGEHGYLSSVVAGWSVPLLLLLICTFAISMGKTIETTRARFSGHMRPART